MPKISVCLPIHNSESWLAEAIESIIDQTFKDWEIVTFNDGSTDTTAQVIAHYRRTLGDRWGWEGSSSIGSQGIAKARNWCNDHAKGEIIVVQDSDDISHKDRLKKTWNYFKRHKDIDLVYGSYQYMDVFGKPFDDVKAKPFDFEEWKENNYIPHPTVAYRKKGMLPYRKECKVLDDLFLYLDYHKAGKKIGNMDDILAFYRIRNSSVSNSKEKEIEEMRKVFRAEADSWSLGR